MALTKADDTRTPSNASYKAKRCCYLASRYGRKVELQDYCRDLEHCGASVISSWLWDAEDQTDLQDIDPESLDREARRMATRSINEVSESDILVLFTDPPNTPGAERGGRYVEMGAAIITNARVFVVGPKTNVFCWHPLVVQFKTWAECLQFLVQEEVL